MSSPFDEVVQTNIRPKVVGSESFAITSQLGDKILIENIDDIIKDIRGGLDSDWERAFYDGQARQINWQELAGLDNLPSLQVRSAGHLVGYVENTRVHRRDRCIWIGHIATLEAYRGRGLGRPMAIALQNIVRKYFNFSRIVFQENHPDFWEIDYNKFFEGLGAVPRQGNSPYRPAWTWEWGNDIVVGEVWRGTRPMPNPSPPPFIAGNEPTS